ncbi:hypothetical protein BZA05DRAFT_434707 [Tricharina praecox]|uniref:uncharacterized protein n=1 Tax=Tricharina praecox TaxID=43433 RepID=UPI002220BD44|nr:uncharacterized protein BZA05DRAFT_434707 [Tricharina praecox]KAI5855387.1 hypothetical protein BZA05DRAFT_434707 [Tricharina praecox]
MTAWVRCVPVMVVGRVLGAVVTKLVVLAGMGATVAMVEGILKGSPLLYVTSRLVYRLAVWYLPGLPASLHLLQPPGLAASSAAEPRCILYVNTFASNGFPSSTDDNAPPPLPGAQLLFGCLPSVYSCRVVVRVRDSARDTPESESKVQSPSPKSRVQSPRLTYGHLLEYLNT